MGALAPISPWIPEDDLLLKNAVEDGASLESLAKGAVRFSRRFTISELQERWHSLLYDPVVSAEASVHMTELQNSGPNPPSKSNLFGVSEGNEVVPGKRKEESVRSLYYAMRKRICTEPCSYFDLSFLVAPSFHHCTENGGGCHEQFKILNENPDGSCMIGDPIVDDFEIQDADFDVVRHAFPQLTSDVTAADNVCATAHAFHSGHADSFEGDRPHGIMGRDCLFGFPENISPVSVNEAVGNNMGHSFEHDNVHKDIPHILGESLSLFDSNAGVQEIGAPEQLPLSAFDSIGNNQEPICSEFGGSQDFRLPVSDCDASFHQFGYSSPLPAMPIWRTIEDMTTPAMPTDEHLDNKDKGAGDTLTVPDDGNEDDAKKVSPSGCNVACSEELKERDDRLASSTALSEGEFMDLSERLLNFTHAEVLLFMDDDDDDGKDMMDRSCFDGLNSILLNSPNDTLQNDISGTSDPKASGALDTGLVVSHVACPIELDVNADPLHSGHKVSVPEIIMPSTRSAPNPHSPERRDGVICCVLSTEDPEIPCNDGLFSPSQVLPPFVSSAMQHKSVGSSVPTSTKDYADKQKASEQGPNLVNEERIPGIVASGKIEVEPQVLPEICPNHSIDGSAVRSHLVENDSQALAPRHAGSAEGDPNQCRSLPVAQPSIPDDALKKEFTTVELGTHSDFDTSLDFPIERPIDVSDHMKNQPQNIVDGCKQEADVPVAIQNQASTHAEPNSVEMVFPEPMLNSSISDQEEQLSEDDGDVPHFSDIEAMILDMDLGPCDQDSYLSKEVSRYHYEDTKRAIIRLEQGANSYMQRSIASHRAFALLYGRHLKHYIKKPEVLLGRSTDDVFVDIDLGREGCANKISRRQAIIKMEEDGTFNLKNLGKCSVSVNSKELASGKSVKLSTSSLIEIRGMRLMFEINQKFVRQHVARNTKRNQDKSLKFEWSADGLP